MRMFGCDHCGTQEKVEIANRRPVGWMTIRSSEVLDMSGRRKAVSKADSQYELCKSCTKSLKEFMTKGVGNADGRA